MDSAVTEKMELVDNILIAITEKVNKPTPSCDSITMVIKHCHALDESLEQKQEVLTSQATSMDTLFKNEETVIKSEMTEAQNKVAGRKADVEALETRKQKLEEELCGLVLELHSQKKDSMQVRQDALAKIPKDKYTCSLMKNITNIEWDLTACQKPLDVVKGAIVTKSEIKNFSYETTQHDSRDIQESLWAMMKERQNYKTP